MAQIDEKIGIDKSKTGIQGLDEVTGGGLPKGRPTLICGDAGCGKTIFGVSFLVHGATLFDEPGVFMCFEERATDLIDNVRSLGYNLDKLIEDKKIFIDHVAVGRNDFEQSGEYDLEGLFVRLDFALRSIGAKRLVIDTIETLFSAFRDEATMRAELVRLFTWLKDRGVTAIVTGERGEGSLTRHGLEEYVSDCVILLDHRVDDQVSTRRLRVVKYRGSTHGTNEYPFLLDTEGITVVPITSLSLSHGVSSERVSTGVPRLDTMLGGDGYYRGSSILITGTAGTGKSTLAAHFVNETCARGEVAMVFAFEESSAQIVRNMKSVGIDLWPWIERGLLHIEAARPMLYGLEAHLVHLYRMVERHNPTTVVVDPISNLISTGSLEQANAMVYRLLDHLKMRNITALYTNLTHGDRAPEQTDIGISSLMDVWLLLRDIESGGERNRGVYVLKARGIGHSNQIREFTITNNGIELLDTYIGPEGVLTGSARATQEARERAARAARDEELERRNNELTRLRKRFEAQVTDLQARFEGEEEELLRQIDAAADREERISRDRVEMGTIRHADNPAEGNGRRRPARTRTKDQEKQRTQ